MKDFLKNFFSGEKTPEEKIIEKDKNIERDIINIDFSTEDEDNNNGGCCGGGNCG